MKFLGYRLSLLVVKIAKRFSKVTEPFCTLFSNIRDLLLFHVFSSTWFYQIFLDLIIQVSA